MSLCWHSWRRPSEIRSLYWTVQGRFGSGEVMEGPPRQGDGASFLALKALAWTDRARLTERRG
jgi:hypothetical protein